MGTTIAENGVDRSGCLDSRRATEGRHQPPAGEAAALPPGPGYDLEVPPDVSKCMAAAQTRMLTWKEAATILKFTLSQQVRNCRYIVEQWCLKAGVGFAEGRRADHATAAPAIAAPDRAWVALCRKAENP